MWHWVARGNIQQISYIPQTEQNSPLGLMLLRLGNVTIIMAYGIMAYGIMAYCRDGPEKMAFLLSELLAKLAR